MLIISPKIGPVSGSIIVKPMGINFEDTKVIKCKLWNKLYIKVNIFSRINYNVKDQKLKSLALSFKSSDKRRKIQFRNKYSIYLLWYSSDSFHRASKLSSNECKQITVYGENFPVGYSNDVKCLFNGEIKTDSI